MDCPLNVPFVVEMSWLAVQVESNAIDPSENLPFTIIIFHNDKHLALEELCSRTALKNKCYSEVVMAARSALTLDLIPQ